MNLKYSGTWSDFSGYGDANRNFIASLFIAGMNLTTELVVQVQERGNFGWVGQLCNTLDDRKIDYKIKIIHLTPDMYPRYMENGKYHIGHLFWETSKLPKEWIGPCNKMNEIWTASEKQAEMIRNSGVTVPIFSFPQPIDTIPAVSAQEPYKIAGFDGFLFYSIFQWIERKNPKALLMNYWKAFEGVDDVGLLLKTYRVNYSANEFERIEAEIKEWKRELGLESYPKIYLSQKLLTTDEMFRLHRTGDCFVTTSRGEGWQRPAAEAMLVGNPVVAVDRTGFADYLPKDSYYPCEAREERVTEVSWIPWYQADQRWLEISDKDLMENMKKAYQNKKESRQIGKKAQKYVLDNFNFWAVGNAMKERLGEIEKFL